MLGDFQKMVVLSSTSNQWPPPQNIVDEKGLKASSTVRVMEKSSQDHQQQQHQQHGQQQLPPPPHLKCPRCDSSNTKFCYYNNYSLSQPRHFCKACKRYWTRGGTLRNVPVGGGCRKNKRVKSRPSTTTTTETSTNPLSSVSTNPNIVQSHVLDLSSTSSHMNPMFYGLPTNHSDQLNLQYPRVNSRDHVSGFDLQPRVNNVLGLGFSTGILGSDQFNSTKQIHDPVYNSSSYPIHNHGSSTSNSTTSSLASLIASSFQHQKLIMQGGNNFQGLLPFENLNMGNVEGGMMIKDMKMEGGGQHRFDHNWNGNNQNQMQQMNSSDPSSLWNNTNGVGSWLDPSVPSLI